MIRVRRHRGILVERLPATPCLVVSTPSDTSGGSSKPSCTVRCVAVKRWLPGCRAQCRYRAQYRAQCYGHCMHFFLILRGSVRAFARGPGLGWHVGAHPHAASRARRGSVRMCSTPPSCPAEATALLVLWGGGTLVGRWRGAFDACPGEV